jgi:hypothetical protein
VRIATDPCAAIVVQHELKGPNQKLYISSKNPAAQVGETPHFEDHMPNQKALKAALNYSLTSTITA